MVRILFTFLAFVFVLGLSNEALAKKRVLGPSSEFRFRLSTLFGPMGYVSENEVSGLSTIAGQEDSTDFNGEQPGVGLELEAWYKRSAVRVKGDFFHIDYQGRPENFRGKPIYAGSVATEFGFRLLGRGGFRGTELDLFTGPDLHYFPNVKSYVLDPYYDVTYLDLLSARGGARLRFPLSKLLSVQSEAWWILPWKLLGGRTELVRGNSNSYGGSIIVDYQLDEGIVISGGWQIDFRNLVYIPDGRAFQQEIRFRSNMGLVSVAFWF